MHAAVLPDGIPQILPHLGRYMGLLTAVFAIGQIMGPPAVGLILKHAVNVDAGFDLVLAVASLALVIGAAIYVAMNLLFPSERNVRTEIRSVRPT
nr:YbfB/YjiJ family MFS transporter [Rhizobium acidisoli]